MTDIRIDFTSDESVVKAVHPNMEMRESRFGWDIYSNGERLSAADCGAQWNAYKTARLHSSVAKLDEARKVVIDWWPSAEPTKTVAGWDIVSDGSGEGYAVGSGATEASAWMNTASRLGIGLHTELSPAPEAPAGDGFDPEKVHHFYAAEDRAGDYYFRLKGTPMMDESHRHVFDYVIASDFDDLLNLYCAALSSPAKVETGDFTQEEREGAYASLTPSTTMTDLQCELNRLKASAGKGEWIAVEDRLPEEGVRCNVFVSNDDDGYYIAFLQGERWVNEMGGEVDDGYATPDPEDRSVTHWQPLPSPPSLKEPRNAKTI